MMHCQEMQFGKQEWNLHINRWWTSFDCSLLNFKKCSLLRRTRHFKANCKDFLIGKGIKWIIKGAMLDVVFGKNGFVEAENKED